MAAVMTAPMGPPMGGPMGPPPSALPQMPNMGGMAPPMGQPPMSGPQDGKSSVVSGFGGSARGRAGFKASLRNRKQQFQQKQIEMPQMPQVPMPPQAMPPQGPGASFGQVGGAPMGAMRPPPPMQPMGSPPMGIAGPGRMVGDNASVGSAPVQMMSGGVVPLFNGLGRY